MNKDLSFKFWISYKIGYEFSYRQELKAWKVGLLLHKEQSFMNSTVKTYVFEKKYWLRYPEYIRQKILSMEHYFELQYFKQYKPLF